MSGETQSMPLVGRTIAGKYRLVRVLGEGGMGIVYEAVHLGLNQRVALKMLKKDPAERLDAVARFEREARAVARLRGQNVAHVSDVDRLEDGTPYIVMEYLEGHDLGEELADRGQIPVGDAVAYLLQACMAMAEAHHCNIVHRDLKPSNLYLCARDGQAMIKVLDFGISKLTMEEESSVTQTHLSLGTPLYMSPEQIRSAKHVDARSDIWSLGVILYELLAGRAPFDAEGATGVIAAITADAPIPLRQHRPDITEPFEQVVMKALEKDPSQRYPNAEAFARALLPFADDESSWTAPPRHSFDSINSDDSVFLRETEIAKAPVVQHQEAGAPDSARPTRRRLGRRPTVARASLGIAALLLIGGGIWGAKRSGDSGAAPARETTPHATSPSDRAPRRLDQQVIPAAKSVPTRGASGLEPAASEAPAGEAPPQSSKAPTATSQPASAPRARKPARTTARPEPSQSTPNAAPTPAAQVKQPTQAPPPEATPGRNPLHL